MTTGEIANFPKDLSLDRIIAECKRVGADPHKVIALALTDEQRVNAQESGMTMKEQANLA